MRLRRKYLLLLGLGLYLCLQAGGIAWSQVTERVSVDSAGAQVDHPSNSPSLSSDGRYVAFESISPDLVVGDTNGKVDIFVHDRDADGNGTYDEPGAITTVRVSVVSGGAEGSDHSHSPSLSSDGMHVAFESSANDLVAVDINPLSDMFVHDLLGGTTTLVSVDSAGDQDPIPSSSSSPSLSSDGRYVAFQSDADLVLPDVHGVYEVFVRDRQTLTTTRVSVDSGGVQGDNHSYSPSLSSDGRYVAFESSAANLVPGGSSGLIHIFVHDRDADSDGIYDDEDGSYDPGEVSTVQVSVDSAGVEGDKNSNGPSISSDGSSVAFESDATNLVANDTNDAPDIFVDDLQAGAGEDGGGGSSSGGGGCFIATAADGSVVTGEK